MDAGTAMGCGMIFAGCSVGSGANAIKIGGVTAVRP